MYQVIYIHNAGILYTFMQYANVDTVNFGYNKHGKTLKLNCCIKKNYSKQN